MIIDGKIVKLRAIEEDDLEMLRTLINDKNTEYLVGTWNIPISKAAQRKWFENISCDKSSSLHLIIEVEEEGAIGYLTLHNIDWKNRRAMYGMKTKLDRKTKGVGYDTALTIMKYDIEELQLNKLECEFIEINESSIYIHEKKCKWHVDGRRRDEYFQNGRYYDVIIMSILRNEYYELIKDLN